MQIGVYCAPVHGEPEFGISTKVPARFEGIDGWYTIGIGIDQESAIFVSRETNGQPKFPCTVRLFRLAAALTGGAGDVVEASATHQGTTFFHYRGTVVGSSADGAPAASAPNAGLHDEREDHEWWIKASRAVGTTGAEAEPAYDLAPMVVEVRTVATTVRTEQLDGTLTLTPSRWDPCAQLLPMRGLPTVELVTNRIRSREIRAAGTLDPVGFWPFADTIGGSRWPGRRGAPAPPGDRRG